MSRYIDADALIKDGWHLQRTVRAENSVSIEVKDLKDVPAVDGIDTAYPQMRSEEMTMTLKELLERIDEDTYIVIEDANSMGEVGGSVVNSIINRLNGFVNSIRVGANKELVIEVNFDGADWQMEEEE